jgi:hypothetical protein
VKLELRSSNYTQWKSFESLCGKFGLLAHINGTGRLTRSPTHGCRMTPAFVVGRMAPSITPSSTSPWSLTRPPINSGWSSRTTSQKTRHLVPSS